MKWGKDQENEAAQGFLTQICMQTLAELLVVDGVEKVKLRYSYPTAFGSRDRTRWVANWSTIRGNLSDVTSIPIEEDQKELLCREAVAATHYFSKHERLVIQQGAVTLDIGGGTTDIAVWHKDAENQPSLLAHLSVLFAGRDVFLAPLSKQPKILTILDENIDTSKLAASGAQEHDNAYWAFLNAVIATHGDTMKNRIGTKAMTSPVAEFLQILEIGLCGIGFYAGLQVGKLVHDGLYRDPKTISVFIGGNGSKLFDWCSLGAFKHDTAFYKSFPKSFLAGARYAVPELNAKIEVHLSPRPKEEVAAGMVTSGMPINLNTKESKEAEHRFPDPMAGEAFTVSGKDISKEAWADSIEALDVAERRVEVDESMPVFAKFIESLDHVHLNLSLSSEEIAHFSGPAQNKLNELAGEMKDQNSEHPERSLAADKLRRSPVFFEALRAFLHGLETERLAK
jgi:hypothetical protein